jgi:hypothetical protein
MVACVNSPLEVMFRFSGKSGKMITESNEAIVINTVNSNAEFSDG